MKSLSSLSKTELLSRIEKLAQEERRITLELLKHLIEIDRRRRKIPCMYSKAGVRSFPACCTERSSQRSNNTSLESLEERAAPLCCLESDRETLSTEKAQQSMPHRATAAAAAAAVVSVKKTLATILVLLCLSTLRRASSSAGLAQAAFLLPTTVKRCCRRHGSCTLSRKHAGSAATPRRTLLSSSSSNCSSSSMTTTASGSAVSQPQLLSLAEFLMERKRQPTKNLVLGNEAGDADSIVSAITLAYVDCLLLRMGSDTTCNNNNDEDDIDSKRQKTPVVSISKADLETQRPETVLLLQLAGVSTDALLFVDDPWIVSEQQQSTFDVTLVDHNRLSNKFSRQHRVVEIVDHHSDEGHYLDIDDNNGSGCRCVRNIAFSNSEALVASTCTLVVERLNEVRGDHHSFYYPAPLSLLLLGVILLDSVNMAPAAGKAVLRYPPGCSGR